MNQDVKLIINILYVFVVKCLWSHQPSHGFNAKLVNGGFTKRVLLAKDVLDLSAIIACRLRMLVQTDMVVVLINFRMSTS